MTTLMLTDTAQALQDEYLDVLRAGIRAHPRSHQKLIGPSEIGNPCSIALIHKLNQDPEPDRGAPWRPAVGTALHTQVEEWFQAMSAGEEHHGRWLTEQRVTVGTIGGIAISGSTDLWDEWSRAVIDHKFVGTNKLRQYRTHGPEKFPQYRIQAHLYGKGWENIGKRPDLVMVAFVPRDGELDESWFWWEEYRPEVADAALERANRLYDSIQVLGVDAVLGLYQPCKNTFCPWCGGPRRSTGIPALTPFTPTE
jgi:hypothetical protein